MGLRRVLPVLLILLTLVGYFTAQAQPSRRSYRIGILHGAYFPGTPAAEGLKAGLKAQCGQTDQASEDGFLRDMLDPSTAFLRDLTPGAQT